MAKKWDLIGIVYSSSYRTRVLSKLSEGNKTPTQLSKNLDIKISHISRTLDNLVSLGLAKILTPRLRKGRVYGITKTGEVVLENVNMMILQIYMIRSSTKT